MNRSQKEKSKFRQSAKWKKFRNYMKKKRNVDSITFYPLRRGWNLHHCNLREEFYTDISDEDKFECLNKMTHEMVHNIYRYWEKDKDVLKRIEKVLEKMERYSNE